MIGGCVLWGENVPQVQFLTVDLLSMLIIIKGFISYNTIIYWELEKLNVIYEILFHLDDIVMLLFICILACMSAV